MNKDDNLIGYYTLIEGVVVPVIHEQDTDSFKELIKYNIVIVEKHNKSINQKE